jgi:hypothetical protein
MANLATIARRLADGILETGRGTQQQHGSSLLERLLQTFFSCRIMPPISCVAALPACSRAAVEAAVAVAAPKAVSYNTPVPSAEYSRWESSMVLAGKRHALL